MMRLTIFNDFSDGLWVFCLEVCCGGRELLKKTSWNLNWSPVSVQPVSSFNCTGGNLPIVSLEVLDVHYPGIVLVEHWTYFPFVYMEVLEARLLGAKRGVQGTYFPFVCWSFTRR